MKKRFIWLFLALFSLSYNANYIEMSPSLLKENNNLGEIIDLSDTSDAEVISYYSGVEGLKGEDLKDTLTEIIDTDYYTTYSHLWDWMKITDRDWSISDSIDPYTYDFDSDTNYYFRNLYATYNGDETRATSNLNNTSGNSYVDREHCYPKSYGFKFKPYATSTGNGYLPPAGTDLHHLIASDHNNNNAHSNYAFGNVDESRDYTIVNDKDSQGTGNPSGLKGFSLMEGNEEYTVFEPLDEYKGDVARACLYMATRYNAKTDISSENPQLHLTDDLSKLEIQSLGDEGGIGYYGELSTLLEWNELDPVDSYEIHRNNLIYNNVQGNRNPYIDHPEWAEIVYDADYSGEGAVNDAPAQAADGTGIKSVSVPNKTKFSLGEEFSYQGLALTAIDTDGNEISYTSDDELLRSMLNFDTKTLGSQTVTIDLDGKTYELYDIYVTNEGAVIGEGDGEVTAQEQAQAFSDYVISLGTGNTEDREIYEELKGEYDYMDDSSRIIFDTSDSFEEAYQLFQDIKANNMTSSERYQEYWDFLLANPLYFILVIVILVAIIAIAIFSKSISKKRKRRTKKRR